MVSLGREQRGKEMRLAGLDGKTYKKGIKGHWARGSHWLFLVICG